MSRLLVRRARRPGLSPRAGFTLLELMISLSIFAIVVAGVFESLTRQHKTSIVTENVVEVQNNVRAIGSQSSVIVIMLRRGPIVTLPCGVS